MRRPAVKMATAMMPAAEVVTSAAMAAAVATSMTSAVATSMTSTVTASMATAASCDGKVRH